MVYLFHFELPVEEATWTCLATAYRPYLKCLTVSEVDACAAAVMHLSRGYDAVNRRPRPSGDDEGGGDGAGPEDAARNGADDDQPEITFLTFFYVNTKKGIIIIL
ncbi:filamin-A isoform X4 [Aphis craccivora]|uniref:Filamin-A isoform X4 n=1 Tax=Aphis craccivora TaxID=307492 RepID=A0A6G0ZN53_APHCR|nr:filamin-A isoform X4 [Aphis craccivora]